MKILLLNSTVRFGLAKTGNNDKTEPVQAGPSYGLLSMASVLARAGHEIINIDPNIYPEWASFAERLHSVLPDVQVVGISSYSPAIFNDESIIRYIRESCPHVLIVTGGYSPTLRPGTLLESSEIDLVIAGEGDIVFEQVVSIINHRHLRHPLDEDHAKELLAIPGVGVRYIRNSQETFTVPHKRARVSQEKLDSLPPPFWELAPLEAYRDFWNSKYINFSTSRGCDRNCPFCSIIDFHGRGLRFVSPTRVAFIIRDANERIPDLDWIFFCDAHFTAVPARTQEICERIISLKEAGRVNPKLSFGCEARVDTMAPEFLDIMRRAGFSEIWLGLESGSDKVLKEYAKGQQVTASRQAVTLAEERNLVVIAFLMIASPNSTVDDVLATLDLALYVLEHGGDITPDVSYCQIAWEGTRLMQEIREKDFDVGFIVNEFSKTDLASGQQVRKLVAEGGYVFPADPLTRQLVLGAYLHARSYGKMNTSTLLAGFFLCLRDLFEAYPLIRERHIAKARNLLARARSLAERRRMNNWGSTFKELLELDPLLV